MSDPERSRWYRGLGSPSRVLAPMVDQSEPAFRELCRRHGCDLAYTPMFNARIFADQGGTTFTPLEGTGSDRPLVVQFAGHDPAHLLAAGKLVQDRCDAVDINLGCPQRIAKRGRFGAFLLEEHVPVEPEPGAGGSSCCSDWPLLRELVGTLRNQLDVPVTCKIRVFDDAQRTIELARTLQDAGCSLLTVHGRTLAQKGRETGAPRWEAIARVKQAVSIPVLANGGIETSADMARCLAQTGCDGCMVAEAALENPAIWEGGAAGAAQEELGLELLAVLREGHHADLNSTKQHLFTMCYAGLQVHTDLRGRLHKARELDEMEQIVRELQARPRQAAGPFNNAPGEDYTSWYHRHRWEWWKHEKARGVNVCKAFDHDGVLAAGPRQTGEAPAAAEDDEPAEWMQGLF